MKVEKQGHQKKEGKEEKKSGKHTILGFKNNIIRARALIGALIAMGGDS